MSPVDQEFHNAVSELRTLATEVRQDLGAQDSELKELQINIKQTQSEIDRLTPRRNDAVKRVRDMEKNVEHFSRDDILHLTEDSSTAQLRLFSMEAQLEQLEYKKQLLERARRNLLRFAALVDQLPREEPTTDHGEREAGSSAREVLALTIKAEEGERRRSAVVIHDGSTQQLTNLVLRAQLCQRLLESDPEKGRQEFRDLQTALSAALQESRRLIHELRPLAIEDLGLFVSLRRYVQALSDREGQSKIELHISGTEMRFEGWQELALFRIVQEPLGNAARHSGAKLIRVTVESSPTVLRATVEDNGAGFDPPVDLASARAKHQPGLTALYDRTALLGGTLTIDSRIGQGTRVRFEIPLEE